MWGQVSLKLLDVSMVRIIPTRVGTSANDKIVYFLGQDHPHACGDKHYSFTTVTARLGSSPRVWGQVGSIQICPMLNRIIPTRVGTRVVKSCDTKTLQDHPHACGDKEQVLITQGACVGSSPRVWGQVDYRDVKTNSSGIIPTRVGTRVFANANFLACEDHPHACGDK